MITVVAGLPAAGKSTLFHGSSVFEFDEWVCKTYGKDVEASTAEYGRHYPESNRLYLDAVCAKHHLGDVVLVDTFIYRKDRMIAVDYFRSKGIYRVNLLYIVASLNTLQARNEARQNSLDCGIILNMWMNQEFPNQNEGFSLVEIIAND